MKIALIGNPNAGKTSLFNQLTGLNQKVANFTGVTVEKKTGTFTLPNQKKVFVTDLPGTYSLYPKSADEQVVLDFLLDTQNPEKPDIILVVADASNLQRNLLLFSEVQSLGFPIILVLNMIDIAQKSGWEIDLSKLSALLQTPIVCTNSRSGEGIQELKQKITDFQKLTPKEPNSVLQTYQSFIPLFQEIAEKYHLPNIYWSNLYLHHYERLTFLKDTDKQFFQTLQLKNNFHPLNLQAEETLERFREIEKITSQCIQKHEKPYNPQSFTRKIDKILLHPIWGYSSFLIVLLLIFTAIFQWAELPMNWIEQTFVSFQSFFKENLPSHFLTNLWTNGILAGISSVVTFIPQIALLFGFIAILEETGYMTRVMIMMDKIMRKFGLNGKSIVPLISGAACAIPAILATRNIDNPKERLITTLVVPLISCSARLPIYTVMIALIVPNKLLWGFLHYQALALLAMYLLGLLMAMFAAKVLNRFLPYQGNDYFIVEMPTYKMPRWKNVGITIFEKVKTFVIDAGKVIIVISVILWALASYSWGDNMEQAEKAVRMAHPTLSEAELVPLINSARLESSFAGILGKTLEPIIEPLGFDWKIGISLITSFAAREVFIATMSVIYGLGDEGDEQSVRQKMATEINPKTGKPKYSLAVGFSLMIFYAFAMQCMSTFAVVWKETRSIRYPLGQLVFFNILAYLASWITYNLLR
ncbi:MAG: ferrous iron transport protein B [Raineya sp.]|nr:ferrous iron transport protein B [Raineya sp.]MDW8295685.1 ferrous iron transport protein B [Raineya sp.]